MGGMIPGQLNLGHLEEIARENPSLFVKLAAGPKHLGYGAIHTLLRALSLFHPCTILWAWGSKAATIYSRGVTPKVTVCVSLCLLQLMPEAEYWLCRSNWSYAGEWEANSVVRLSAVAGIGYDGYDFVCCCGDARWVCKCIFEHR